MWIHKEDPGKHAHNLNAKATIFYCFYDLYSTLIVKNPKDFDFSAPKLLIKKIKF